MRTGNWIQTYTGRKFNPINPQKKDICWVDIFHALSNVCRFTGHCAQFYSVAQHSVLASRLASNENKLWALMHDASEAYLCDVASPIKNLPAFAEYRCMEKNIMSVICQCCGLPIEQPEEIKIIDLILLRTEARDLKLYSHEWGIAEIEPLKEKIDPWAPQRAEEEFQKTFDFMYYFGGKNCSIDFNN